MLAPSAFIHKTHPEAAFATNCNVNVATAVAAVSSRGRRLGLLPLKPVARARPWREASSADDRLWSTHVTGGEGGGAEDAQEDDFVPTEVRRCQ